MQIIDLYPNPLPPPGPPVTRESTLADLQTGFGSLTDDELKVARLWLVGETLDEVCCILQMREKRVLELWRSMRRKLRLALLDKAARVTELPPTGEGTGPSATGLHNQEPRVNESSPPPTPQAQTNPDGPQTEKGT
jgi:DNA-binding CsgD family transcriptional regulator